MLLQHCRPPRLWRLHNKIVYGRPVETSVHHEDTQSGHPDTGAPHWPESDKPLCIVVVVQGELRTCTSRGLRRLPLRDRGL